MIKNDAKKFYDFNNQDKRYKNFTNLFAEENIIYKFIIFLKFFIKII
jgi:hypothetical protein